MKNIENLENADDFIYAANEAYYEMLKQGEYIKVLDIIAKNKDYTFKNAMLIHLQRPSAKSCMTQPRWKDAGKEVLKGSKPIIIYKQLYDPYQDKGDKNATGKGVEILPSGIYQKVYLYDIKDTFGKANKKEYTYRDIENHFEAVKDSFKACCKDYCFEYRDTVEVEGTAIIDKKEKKIYIKNSIEKKKLFYTLVQSTAIALSKTSDRRTIPCVTQEKMKNISKYESAAVTYILCKRFQVEPPKLLEPSISDKDDSLIKAYILNLAYVRKIANRITDKIIYAINYEIELKKKALEEEEKKKLEERMKENSALCEIEKEESVEDKKDKSEEINKENDIEKIEYNVSLKTEEKERE